MELNEWMFYFLVYSLCGFLLENVYSWFTTGVFWKEGYLKGPYKPMYGFAPLLLLLLSGAVQNRALLWLFCLLVPTIVEYVSGLLLYKLFGRRWWDYSDNRLQLAGHICLRFSLYWGGLSFVFLQYIHPVIQNGYARISELWTTAGPLLLLLFMLDMMLTYRSRRKAWKADLI
ncbi:putative ABC transporter permease [Paenibacillus aceti]|uniref:Membrane protein n=1 Tax=Paenibacillus aceti TaxID=1820010 RepID=A0ABQ1W0M7_9BACL|nr:putative ABC transporter permease [Paenibacillus aceti]GGG07457.1 membrane protein [Paenibacillus aceti]